MSHHFSGVMFSSHHYAHPFTCPCRHPDHSLNLGQRVFVVAMAILAAIPTFGVGGVLTFYVLSAVFKARNVVWMGYLNEYPSRRSGFVLFIPSYWGFRFPVYRSRDRHDGHRRRRHQHVGNQRRYGNHGTYLYNRGVHQPVGGGGRSDFRGPRTEVSDRFPSVSSIFRLSGYRQRPGTDNYHR